MSRFKKILPVLWAGVLIVSMFTSCAGGEKPDEQQSGKGKAPQSITVLVETGSPTQEVVEALKTGFTEKTGIELSGRGDGTERNGCHYCKRGKIWGDSA